MQKRQKDYHPYIDQYMDDIRLGKIPACKELKQAMDLIEEKLNNPDVFIDHEKIQKAVELIEKYFDIKLLNWELFIIALIHCYYKSRDAVVFKEFFIMMGRGNGKNGFISAIAWYLTTHYHGVKKYNVDIVANSEEQAKTSFEDIYEMLEDTWKKSKKFFYKTKEKIVNIKTRSYIKYNTSNSKTKDGKRVGCIIFDEIHEYEDWKLINVFQSGFGKKKHSRVFFITTNGYVRGGVLDDQLDLAKRILSGEVKNLQILPLIWKLDDKEEYKDPANWVKAAPSYEYFPVLQEEMKSEFVKMQYQPHVAIEFLTKRMNIPAQDNFTPVVPWEKILATNQPIPYKELDGLRCLGGVDYARTTDFASCGLLFKYKGKRYWIEHTFVCHKALEIESRPIMFPVRELAETRPELITIINRDNISASDIAGWFLEQAKKYHILNILCDEYRKALLEDEFQKAGLPLESVRSGPITHAKVAPLIEQIFAEETLVFGDNPTMRWYVNNTCQEIDKKGNIAYYKIEPKTRKTDGFFALVHVLSRDSELEWPVEDFMSFDVYTY